MFLSDFRPVSFEYNGNPLSMVNGGIVMNTNEVLPANTDYSIGDRREIITITSTYDTTSGNPNNLIDGSSDFYKIEVQDNTPDGNYILVEFDKPQVFDKLSITAKNFTYTPTINFYCSENNTDWVYIGTFGFLEEEKVFTMVVSLPLGDFKYVKFGSLTEDTSIHGEVSKLEFNIIDKPITKPIIQSDKDGILEFDANDIIDVDDELNKKVSINILNNDKVASNGIVDKRYEVFSFTGQRILNDTIIPGKTQIKTYLSVNEPILCDKQVYAGTYLQTELGVIKFKDNYNDTWRDLQYNGEGMTTNTGSITGLGGLYIEDTSDNFEVVVTSGNISTVVNSLELIPDESIVNNHIADTNIHYSQSEINITENQISDFGTYLTTHQDISYKADKLNIKLLRYSEITSDGSDKFELLTMDGESIDIDNSALFANQGSVFVDGKKAPNSTITFTFESSKNYITFSSAPDSGLVIEVERIFI
jgi:hypothetical protein